jgi:hypothetical protein
MHETPAWQIDMLLAGLQADEAVGMPTAGVDDELRADPDDGGAFGDLPPYLRS